MTTEAHDHPTAAEWKILKIVCELGPCAARAVISVAEKNHAWSASTVKTLLRRLVDKGQLLTQPVGSSFLYRPSRPIQRVLRESADQLLEQATAEAVGPLLQYMVRQSSLSAADLDALRSLIDAQRKKERR